MTICSPKAIFYAILAALLYALNAPFSKLLLTEIPSTMMAGLLYLGAGIGMSILEKFNKNKKELPLTKKEVPYTIAMVVLDIAAPIFLMIGLTKCSAANASLLNNFEIVATAGIAFLVFRERISPRLCLGIVFVVLSCLLLSFEDIGALRFSKGSLFVLLAALCWGLENNCTRKLSEKDPLQIVLLKGIFSGLGSLVIGVVVGERLTVWWCVPAVLGVGLVAYGMSIFCYVYAQRLLGAARTSAYYAIAPFIGAALSLLIFRILPGPLYLVALVFMMMGAWLSASDAPRLKRKRAPNAHQNSLK